MFAIKTLHKRIALLSLAAAVLAVLAISPTRSQDKGDSGVTVSGNRATLKTGFAFRRTTSNQLEVRKVTAGVMSDTTIGIIECTCTKAPQNPPEGSTPGCAVSIENRSIAVCDKVGGCQECKMSFAKP